MARRKELKSIAHGLLGSFISRNNDVGGYWALGKLYRHALSSKSSEIRIDLTHSAITPPDSEFDEMCRPYRKWLLEHLAARKAPVKWVKEAEIQVRFTGDKAVESRENVFQCLVRIEDDLGHVYEASGVSSCWSHNPFREQSRLRKSKKSWIHKLL